MIDAKRIRWSRFTNTCHDCGRRFRIENYVIDENRAGVAEAMGLKPTDEDVAAVISLCHKCTSGDEGVGEFVDENQDARRWDPKGWALDTMAAMVREVLAHFDQGAREGDPETAEIRLRRRAFVAQALRDRIDGKY